MSAAAIIAIRRKKLVKRFREAGATDAAHAVSLDVLGVRRSWIFNQMAKRGAFLPTQDGCYFMDDQVAEEFLRQRRMRAVTLSGILLLVFLLLWCLARLGK